MPFGSHDKRNNGHNGNRQRTTLHQQLQVNLKGGRVDPPLRRAGRSLFSWDVVKMTLHRRSDDKDLHDLKNEMIMTIIRRDLMCRLRHKRTHSRDTAAPNSGWAKDGLSCCLLRSAVGHCRWNFDFAGPCGQHV